MSVQRWYDMHDEHETLDHCWVSAGLIINKIQMAGVHPSNVIFILTSILRSQGHTEKSGQTSNVAR